MSQAISAMGRTEWTLLLVLSLLWGGSFFFAKVALAEIAPLRLVFLRVAIAAAGLWILLGLLGLRLPRGAGLWPLAAMGLLNNVVPFTLLFWGMTRIDSGLAAILNATTPLFTVLVAHLFTDDEKLTKGKLAGVALGLGGVVVLVGPSVLQGLGGAALAQTACLGAAVLYAVSAVWGRRLSANPPLVNAAGQLTMSSLMLAPLVLLFDRPWLPAAPSAHAWWAVGGLALASTALAYVIFFRILRSSGATSLLLVTLLIPASALLLGIVLLGERPGPDTFSGLALIGLGLAAIDGRPAAMLGRLRNAGAAGDRR